jgi:hypothetical protein
VQGNAQASIIQQERVPMSTSFFRLISRLLIVCLIGLPFQVNAGMIGTDSVVSAAQAQVARNAVASFISRTDVAGQLQALGLTPESAKERVAALTDAEVAKLAGQIDSLPAGAKSSTGWAVLLLVLLGILIYWSVKK